jgi:hypothetical protein
VESWTAEISSDLDLAASDLSPRRSVVHMEERQQLWDERGGASNAGRAKIAQIHRYRAETPLLVVLLAEKGLSDGAIGLGRSRWRN